MGELEWLSDILVVKSLLGLAASTFGSPLLAVLSGGSGVFFTGRIVGRRLTVEQAWMNAGQTDQRLGRIQLGMQTTKFCLKFSGLRLLGGSRLGRAPRGAWL